jgi:hypothetical protein
MGVNVRQSGDAATKRMSLVASASVLALGGYFQSLLQRLHLALAVDEAMPRAPRESTDGGLIVSSSAAAVSSSQTPRFVIMQRAYIKC